MSQKKDKIKDIRTNLLTRGFSLAKAGIRAGGLGLSGFKGKMDPSHPAWLDKVEFLIKELGQLKGSAMKVGQTLSMYGEHLLPKEVNDLLKTLQQDSPALEWDAIRSVVKKELGEDLLKELEFEEEAMACASIGQVHKARIKESGQVLAIKIQYPGIDAAVDTDLKLLKFILNVTEMVPRGPRFDQIFNEIKEMFHQEVNYELERNFGERFLKLLDGDSNYLVPKFHTKFCTRKVLAMEFVEGVRVDHEKVQSISQERRNRLGLLFLDLYMRELMDFQLMQTDPHFGNYLIQVDPNGERDRLVLLDFGAARGVPDEFLASYRMLIEGGLMRDARLIEKGGRQLGLLQPEDPMALIDDYVKLCGLITEPFHGTYDWGTSDLPKRTAAAVANIAGSYRLRAPPRELVFLDRKLGGVFIFLSGLKCKVDGRQNVLSALNESKVKNRQPSL
jgi:predicted unusual protein kinase regulating ubiquinone biosynthesis (AarF/ABC1/UbiB family)